jgi:hypothetical protein
MINRIEELTYKQRCEEWSDRWNKIGLFTNPAVHQKFEVAAEHCYRAAGLDWHRNVIWVSSPIVMAIAVPVAAMLIEISRHRGLHDTTKKAVYGTVRNVISNVVGTDIYGAVLTSVEAVIDGLPSGTTCVTTRGAISDVMWFKEMHKDKEIPGTTIRVISTTPPGTVDVFCYDESLALTNETLDLAEKPMREVAYGGIYDAVGLTVKDVMDNVMNGMKQGEAVHKAIAEVIRKGEYRSVWRGHGSLDCLYASLIHYLCGPELEDKLWKPHEVAAKSAGTWYSHRDFVMVCERPTFIHRELARPDRARGWRSHHLHCADGPAVAWADGWGVYAIHGVHIPFLRRHIVEHPERITLAEIEDERNAEIRRILIDRFGMERYIAESGAITVDEYGTDHPITGLRTARLLRKEIRDDEPIVCLDMLNSTPEPDGTTKRYLIRVDPDAYEGQAGEDCLAAMASTYRLPDGSLLFDTPEDYAPAMET